MIFYPHTDRHAYVNMNTDTHNDIHTDETDIPTHIQQSIDKYNRKQTKGPPSIEEAKQGEIFNGPSSKQKNTDTDRKR